MAVTYKIELKYFKTIGQGFQWYLLYEFVVSDQEIFKKADSDIIQILLSNRILNKTLYHPEMSGIEVELTGLRGFTERPYNFDRLDLNDFKCLNSKADFEEWLENFRTEGWEDDYEDAQLLTDITHP